MAELRMPQVPLSDTDLANLLPTYQAGWTIEIYGLWVARAVERAHGIKTPSTLTEQDGQ